jgi:ATP dependent DNA ligase C terminal region
VILEPPEARLTTSRPLRKTVAVRRKSTTFYACKVDHGFDKASAADLRKRLTPLIRKTQPYTKRIAHKGIWVEPELLARRDQVSGEVGRRQGAAPVLQRLAGGPVMK